MQLIYMDTDITEYVQIDKALFTDRAGCGANLLELTFDNLSSWYRWEPERDDRIRIVHGGYDTGALYLNRVLPTEGRYRIWASALPTGARQRLYKSYEDMTLAEIAGACASECGFTTLFYGVDENTRIHYISRNNETAAAFLERLAKGFGAAMITHDRAFRFVGIEKAGTLETAQTFELDADSEDIDYTRNDDKARASVRVLLADGQYSEATDARYPGCVSETVCGSYAANLADAERISRGLLLDRNRRAETLSFTTTFNPGFSAMVKIGVNANAPFAGEWLIDEATHDFINETSGVICVRATQTEV